MGDIKLFRLTSDGAGELSGGASDVEKSLQVLIEKNLETFFGVRLLASEYSTGKSHAGRMDSLGLDEDGSPVIVEYKRSINENVINQGLYYLDWLLDHRGDFEMLVIKTAGADAARGIDWTHPRLLCIASDFTKYDEHAVQQINRNIELVRYRWFGKDLILFELVNSSTGVISPTPTTGSGQNRTIDDRLAAADPETRDRFEAIRAYIMALGDDVQPKTLKDYFAFRRIKNFACVEVHPQARKVVLYLKLDPDDLAPEPGFARDVRKIGHFGTGDLELTVDSDDDLEKVKPLLAKSYAVS